MVPEVDLSSRDPHTFLGGGLCIFFYKCNGGGGQEGEGRHRAYLQGTLEFRVGAGRWGREGSQGRAIIFLCRCSLGPAATRWWGEALGLLHPHRSHSLQSKQQP